jgi:hypothetical protein
MDTRKKEDRFDGLNVSGERVNRLFCFDSVHPELVEGLFVLFEIQTVLQPDRHSNERANQLCAELLLRTSHKRWGIDRMRRLIC